MLDLRAAFDTMVHNFIIFEKEFLRYRRLGIDLSLWPNSNENAALFNFLAKLDEGYWPARQNALSAISDFSGNLVSLPENDADLKAFFHTNLRAAQAQLLAKEITFAPNRADELIESFRNQAHSQIAVKSKFDLALSYMENYSRESKQKVIIDGFELLSGLIGGFNGGRVSIVSAYTGFGKSNLAFNLARNASLSGYTTGICNMEMMIDDVVERYLAMELNSTHDEIAREINWTKFIENQTKGHGKNLFITDGKNLSINEIYSYAFTLKKEHDLKLLFVDYDQKIELSITAQTPEWKALQMATHSIETIAKELDIHIVMLAQANDEGTPSGSKRSMYPTSVVLWFTKEDETYILKPIKNRFGPTNKNIRLRYVPEKSIIEEDGYHESVRKEPKGTFGTYLKF